MSLNLNVHFSGLCLFVRDEGEHGSKLHVLLPRSRLVPGAPHVPRLAFDRAHLTPGSARPEGVLVEMDISGGTIEIHGDDCEPAGALETGITPLLPATVDPAALANDAGGQLLARVTLHGGTITRQEDDVWRFAGDQGLGVETRWSTLAPGEGPLRLVLTPFEGGADPEPIPPLYPIEGAMELQIRHVPADELRNRPSASDPSDIARHFTSFYNLIDGPRIPPPEAEE